MKHDIISLLCHEHVLNVKMDIIVLIRKLIIILGIMIKGILVVLVDIQIVTQNL